MSSSAIKNENILSKNKENRLPPPPISVLKKCLNTEFLTVEWLAGDGSDRCYYRIKSPTLDNSLVLMQLSSSDAEQLIDDNYDWIKISDELNSHNIKAPSSKYTLKDYAAIIIDDYGDNMLESSIKTALEEENLHQVEILLEKSLDLILDMIAMPPIQSSPWKHLSFDKEKYVWEFNFFKEKYLELHRNLIFSPQDSVEYETEIIRLSEALAKQSKYFTHRDFHSRNIMLLDKDEMALIDFQDARLGSPIYDWASICFDSYIPVDLSVRMKIFKRGIEKIKTRISAEDSIQVDAYWKHIVIQRSIKALASFAYLELEKNRGSYLQYESTIINFFKSELLDLQDYPIFNKILKKL